MSYQFVPYAAQDLETVVAWLSSDIWPFHVNRQPEPDLVRRWSGEGRFLGPAVRSFWMLDETGERIGLVRLEELDDPTPIFDLRIRSDFRGRGAGTAALRFLARHAFEEHPHVRRLEAHTRLDNHSMRRLLCRCGFVKEAHHRRTWPDGAGGHVDGLSYALLKEDWVTGVTTPVPWDAD